MATAVQPAVVVGGGRVGQTLLSMGPSFGDLLLRRGEALPPSASAGPILVCTHNDDLDGVLDATPKSRWQDLVFFQNGMLDPWLESKGLAGANQVLAYFAISKLDEPLVNGITDANPEGGYAGGRRMGRSSRPLSLQHLGPRRRRPAPERRRCRYKCWRSSSGFQPSCLLELGIRGLLLVLSRSNTGRRYPAS